MAQLAERDQFEQQAFRRLRNLSAQHRREIEAYLGEPPNLRNVPPSFWDRVERETNEELAAILILIMMAAATQEGVPADFASTQASGWGRIRASFAARRMMQTTIKQLNATQEVWNAEISSGKNIGVTRIRADLMKVLGPERMGTVAVTETTKAISAGTLLAAGRGSAAVASQFKVIWRLGNCDHCQFCLKMAGTDQSYWSRYSDGPPQHPSCCCFLQIVPRGTASRTPDSGEPDTEGLFESDHQTCRALVDLLVMESGNGAVVENFSESDHPRDDQGQFVSKGAIAAAVGNFAKEKALRDSVTDPAERAKLDRDLKAAAVGVASTQAADEPRRDAPADAEPRRDSPPDAAPRSETPRPETPRSKERVTVSRPRKITETAGINSSYVVDLEGGKRGVYKPAGGSAKIETHGWDPEMWHPQTMHKSEVAASVLDEMMGLGMVPKTGLADGEHGLGSVQEWSDATAAIQNEMINYKILDRVSEEGRTKLAAFDLLIGNPDRHYANVLADGDKPVAIDNGMGFPKHNDPYREGRYSLKGVWPPDFYAEKLPQDFQDSLGKLLSDREHVTSELKPFLEDDQISAFWKRAEVLQKHSGDFRAIAPPHDKFTKPAFNRGAALEDEPSVKPS